MSTIESSYSRCNCLRPLNIALVSRLATSSTFMSTFILDISLLFKFLLLPFNFPITSIQFLFVSPFYLFIITSIQFFYHLDPIPFPLPTLLIHFQQHSACNSAACPTTWNRMSSYSSDSDDHGDSEDFPIGPCRAGYVASDLGVRPGYI